MVSFVWLFRLLGGIFLMLLPLILIMRRPKGRVAPRRRSLKFDDRRHRTNDDRSRRISPVRKRALEERSLRREKLQLHDEPREDVALRRGDPRPHRHARSSRTWRDESPQRRRPRERRSTLTQYRPATRAGLPDDEARARQRAPRSCSADPRPRLAPSRSRRRSSSARGALRRSRTSAGASRTPCARTADRVSR